MADAFNVFGVVLTDPAKIKSLIAKTSGGANFHTFEFPFGDDFTVTAGKTLVIAKLIMSSSVANTLVTIGYGDDGVSNSASGPTTEKNVSESFLIEAADTQVERLVALPIPAGKLPFMKSGTVATVRMTAMAAEEE